MGGWLSPLPVSTFTARKQDEVVMAKTINDIRVGSTVTISVPNGMGRNGPEYKPKSGRAVMKGPAGWVLNMGGRFGTPAVCTPDNFLAIGRKVTA